MELMLTAPASWSAGDVQAPRGEDHYEASHHDRMPIAALRDLHQSVQRPRPRAQDFQLARMRSARPAKPLSKAKRTRAGACIVGTMTMGGYSGGSMERPALKSLLTEVALGRIDVVVVYKVDRLTRSLADFAKLVELFECRQGVRLVTQRHTVTQLQHHH